MVGYRNAGRGANRIKRFEERGVVHADLLGKLAAVLDVDPVKVEMLIEEDRRQFFDEWIAWANHPIRPYLVIRLVAAFYVSEPLPDDVISVEEAERYASRGAKEWRRCCCLVLSRRYSIWLDEDGAVYDRTEAVPNEPNTPFMRLGRSRRAFLIRSVSPERIIQQVNWPTRHFPASNEDERWD